MPVDQHRKEVLVDTWEAAQEEVRQAAAVKTDISFLSIFSNLIKKMDDGAQSAQSN
jgi:hypothetical protein